MCLVTLVKSVLLVKQQMVTGKFTNQIVTFFVTHTVLTGKLESATNVRLEHMHLILYMRGLVRYVYRERIKTKWAKALVMVAMRGCIKTNLGLLYVSHVKMVKPL